MERPEIIAVLRANMGRRVLLTDRTGSVTVIVHSVTAVADGDDVLRFVPVQAGRGCLGWIVGSPVYRKAASEIVEVRSIESH